LFPVQKSVVVPSAVTAASAATAAAAVTASAATAVTAARFAVLLEALATVHGPALSGLERHLALLPAVRANGFVRFPVAVSLTAAFGLFFIPRFLGA